MSTSSQEPRGTGLSSTLVSDFRAILNSLEQEKAARKGDSDEPAPVAGGRSAGETLAKPVAPPAPAVAGPVPPRRLPPAGPLPPAPYSDVRTKIAALGEVKDMFVARPATMGTAGSPLAPHELPPVPRAPTEGSTAAQPTEAGKPMLSRLPTPVPPAPSAGAETRRRGFGAARDCEPVARRRRATSSDVITWKRLALLTVCMAVAGGGAMALQSVVGREEAKVAPEAIGNAAIASVAPSTPLAAVAAPVAPEAEASPPPAKPAFAIAAAPAPAAVPNVAAIVADVPQPVLRNAAPVFEPAPRPQVPASAAAFASPDSGDGDAAVAVPEKPKAVAMPKQAPLPPPAPSRQVAAATPAEAASAPAHAAAEPAADETPDGDGASQAGFGGDPVGTATIRSSVTMRSEPKRGASAIGNLQSGQKVELVACDGWCEVIVEGKRGFIYKSFVDTRAVRQADAVPE